MGRAVALVTGAFWSTSVMGGVPPLLGPYFAAKAGMDALAVCYARELAPLGIETSIVVPGAFTKGTNHFENAGHPGDDARVRAEFLHRIGLPHLLHPYEHSMFDPRKKLPNAVR